MLWGETGFLVGAMTGFISNFFGQGPWTPWQMFCFGIIGFGRNTFHKRQLKPESICVSSGIINIFIYGGIVDLWTIFMVTPEPQIDTAILVYSTALGFNIIHAFSTVIFLYILADPMIEKLKGSRLNTDF